MYFGPLLSWAGGSVLYFPTISFANCRVCYDQWTKNRLDGLSMQFINNRDFYLYPLPSSPMLRETGNYELKNRCLMSFNLLHYMVWLSSSDREQLGFALIEFSLV